ncbi:MAG: glucan 1,4-alpha-glucosidase [Verrucomicrobiae bacterium]|nr:glucan 1,4-alpha-glucosidase [Verrucomicrobiae bacterium]
MPDSSDPESACEDFAPGWPGIEARWTSSAKDGVGTALGDSSRLWFALSHGIVNEVYFPRIDQACTRDWEFLVTDGASFFSEEKRDSETAVDTLESGVPGYRIVNRCRRGRYTLVKEVFSDPERDCLVQVVHLEKWEPGLRLFALLSPHLKNRGAQNTAWVGDYKGVGMLFAEREGTALALSVSGGWCCRSVGFVGSSDGWQQLKAEGFLKTCYRRAENGNVALTGEVEAGEGDTLTFVLGFGRNASEAGHQARATGDELAEDLRERFCFPWRDWLREIRESGQCGEVAESSELFWPSLSLLRVHEDKTFKGGTIASLSIPWGSSKGDDDLGGYHLVWPRDLCETAGGFLAAGASGDAVRILRFLQASQESDGHWSQNMWLDGAPYWQGLQMDEVALPILLVELAERTGALDRKALQSFWPMVDRAANYLIENGPVSAQDRWEEDAGYSPFTLATEIAALATAGELAEKLGDRSMARRARAKADEWFAKIDDWTYARDTDLAREHGVDGYYMRIAPPEVSDACSPLGGFVAIKNRPPAEAVGQAVEIVSPDALALVRFGLRRADDPRIVNTVKVIDALLKRDLPPGPAWLRYNGDGYGEHEDGSPFDGTGVGRPWPLLAGERAHYELARGDTDAAKNLAEALENFASFTGLIPEQVWDADDIPENELFRGRPSGSAMPLVWAHSEYLKLIRSLKDGAVFDRPGICVRRYLDS